MIRIENLSRDFDGKPAVQDVSLTVERGQIAALVGTSGSGKTTLLRMINRLVEPSSGRVLIDGRDSRDMPAHQLRRRIGYAIQGHGLFPHRSVAQNIATVPRLLKWDRDRIRARVDELLTLFQMDPADFRDRMPSELSGGQQQRVGVARALAAQPDLLLMDEPFGALDPVIRAKAQADLRQIQRGLGTTLILVTHDMDEAITLGDRIAVMDGGRLVQYDTPARILTNPATPFVRNLIGSGQRAFQLLSLTPVSDVAQPGQAAGDPIAPHATLREALSQCLTSGRDALPVAGGGVVTLDALRRAARS
ncbi:ABC transporter ATP-binding protein [Paracoccus sp. 1_MG-2023]|uniref:ABC transporter ATP-binding protein n=1 Tax=unclassified Paracoccus (in: a-proteobacteria) TaxID=2688777 RepID=UPI001C096919|nr:MULTISPECIES: ABC transporter ATP-binding protein [unclassified Paracoccus (in: a-proteobacteria)]MBU2956218.1 ABC transporter ATP-binding protein [Paracoccus sp. C2R09]MDO6667895.1 ABC transporter ATP-binding protein [Paracoccus sp. 1_MG-2023]